MASAAVATLAGDDEHFIQTGIGWVIGDLSKTHPDVAATLVERHPEQLSPEVIRRRTRLLPRHAAYRSSWNGPPIPEHKPFLRGLVARRDGRIRVRLATEAQPAGNENHDPDDPWSAPTNWVETLRYDVLRPDGAYMGGVAPPGEFRPYPRPVFDGDPVWAVTRDEVGVERVARYRIVVAGEDAQVTR